MKIIKYLLRLLVMFVCMVIMHGCQKDYTERFPEHTSWRIRTAMPTARHNLGFVECNDRLYAIGGYNHTGLNTVEAYDPASDSWQTRKPMPTARGYLVTATVGNKIYAIGGINGKEANNITYTNVTEEYDPVTDTWITRAAFPAPKPSNTTIGNQFITGTAMDNKIYIVLGNAGANSSFIYDPANDTWSNAAAPISKFSLRPLFSACNNDNLYVTDGKDFLQYQPAKDEWNELPAAPVSRKAPSLAVYNNNIFIAGGYTPKNNNDFDLVTLKNVEMYNPYTNEWTISEPLNAKRHSAAALTCDNELYIVGGAEKKFNLSDSAITSLESLKIN